MTTATARPAISRSPIPLDAKDVPNVCVLCSHNCGIRVDVAGGRIRKIRADESSPISGGYICNKGFSITRYVEHAQRLEHPGREVAEVADGRGRDHQPTGHSVTCRLSPTARPQAWNDPASASMTARARHTGRGTR